MRQRYVQSLEYAETQVHLTHGLHDVARGFCKEELTLQFENACTGGMCMMRAYTT